MHDNHIILEIKERFEGSNKIIYVPITKWNAYDFERKFEEMRGLREGMERYIKPLYIREEF